MRLRIITRDSTGTVELGALVTKGLRPAEQKFMISNAEWTLGIVPPGTTSYLIAHETFEVLRRATAADDGSFTSGGKRYWLRPNDTAAPPVAEVVPA
ncbi:hypothetical protein [Polyangium spumosum]|uniref:Uncharacterized protein n=1 Tax=Polyangium spumosum TaxID=889282 RepID=A0A6N7Q1A7_9BACT|nr:hypothetical protein [Polyangium spumosum]MRG97487.1 hypothetical protein [Polyangium spumosum]